MTPHRWFSALSPWLLPAALLLPSCASRGEVPPGEPPPDVAARFRATADALIPMDFLVGTWLREEGELWHQEVWSEARGGRMVGHAHLVRGERSVFTEALSIRSMGGVVVYVATPEDQLTTLFPAAELRPGYARFEAPEHDFPQVIEYRLAEDGALVVRLAGLDDREQGRGAPAHDDHGHGPKTREVVLRFEPAPGRP